MNLFQPGVNIFNPFAQQTAVGFELGFTRPAQTNPPFLTLKVSPATDQTGRLKLQLRQFNLQLTFMGTRTLGKNIENQTGTVEHCKARSRLRSWLGDSA